MLILIMIIMIKIVTVTATTPFCFTTRVSLTGYHIVDSTEREPTDKRKRMASVYKIDLRDLPMQIFQQNRPHSGDLSTNQIRGNLVASQLSKTTLVPIQMHLFTYYRLFNWRLHDISNIWTPE